VIKDRNPQSRTNATICDVRVRTKKAAGVLLAAFFYFWPQKNTDQRKKIKKFDRHFGILYLPVYTFQESHAKAQRKEMKKSFGNSRSY
jgi:hypothetical protein